MKSYIPKDWRIWFALGLTFFWCCFLFIYIARNVGWGSFLDLPIEQMGTFLEGAFAFLVFLWLVVGLFIQQSVLAENNEELRRNNLHSEKQTQAIAATEMNARQETFFKIAESTRRQLGSTMGLLFISSQGPIGNNNYKTEDLAEVWKQFAGGDTEIFTRLFLTLPQAEVDFSDLFYGTEIRRRHTNHFIVGFDRLVELAKGVDTDKIILDSLINSAHGMINGRMRLLHPDIKFERIVGTDSIEYLDRMINTRIESS
jgi:hypothetical protein